MNYKYKGLTPVKAGDKVLIKDTEQWGDITATVKHPLAMQFSWKSGKVEGYAFYKDRGAFWIKL